MNLFSFPTIEQIKIYKEKPFIQINMYIYVTSNNLFKKSKNFKNIKLIFSHYINSES
jgi:hypothetical protein